MEVDQQNISELFVWTYKTVEVNRVFYDYFQKYMAKKRKDYRPKCSVKAEVY